jgi:outer membrane lipoprotein-sorting protein
MNFEALREGVEEKPEIDLARLQKYLGSYRSDANLQITTFIQNQRLAIRINGATVFDLRPPNAEGRWAARANAEIAVVFDESEKGEVTGLRFFRPGGVPVVTLAAAPRDTPALPTVAELLALGGVDARRKQLERAVRMTGTVRFPQSAVSGRFQIVSAGNDRSRTDIDLGRNGVIRTAMNGDRGWFDSFSLVFMEIRGEMLEQMRLTPALFSGDWRRHFDAVTVLRQDKLDGRTIYVVELRKKGIPNVTIGVDAETGDVLRFATTLVLPGIGGVPSTSRFEDYRVVDGVRLPFRQIESNEQNGRTVYEIERIEFDIKVDDELFTLRPAETKP